MLRAPRYKTGFPMGCRFPILVALAMVVLADGLPQAAQADDAPPLRYLDSTAKIWAEPDNDARPIGKLLVSAPLRVLSEDEDWTEVEMTGWTQSGAERVIYAAPGIRVLHGAISKSAIESLKFSDSHEDEDTGLTWTSTTLHGWLHKPAIQPDLKSIWNRAEPLFAERCTACHQRRIPDHYTANQWTSHLKVMGPRTGLPKEDQFLIRAYLQYHSKDMARLSGNKEEKGEP